MTPTILYDSSSVTLWYHPEKKIVHHQIHKFVFGEEFQKFLLIGTEALKKNHAQKRLSDDRGNSVLRNEDLEWGVTNWFPHTVQAGWRYWAIVQPEKIMAQVTMQQLVEDYAKAGILARFFTDPSEAMKWLESQ
jgi:hypothetical protein